MNFQYPDPSAATLLHMPAPRAKALHVYAAAFQ
jgi:hypothetical protein